MEKYETYRATCPKCGNMDHFSEIGEFKKRHICSKCKEQFEVSNHLMYKTDIKPEVHEAVQQERQIKLDNRAAEDVALDLEIRQFKDSLEKVGVRYDQDKLRWDLVPMHLLEGMVKVLMVGMKKYSAHNWRLGLHTTRISNSLQRHLNAYLAGEELDPESGLPHVDHILCNALFLKGQAVEHPEMDDRYKKPFPKIVAGDGLSVKQEKGTLTITATDLNALSAPEGKETIEPPTLNARAIVDAVNKELEKKKGSGWSLHSVDVHPKVAVRADFGDYSLASMIGCDETYYLAPHHFFMGHASVRLRFRGGDESEDNYAISFKLAKGTRR